MYHLLLELNFTDNENQLIVPYLRRHRHARQKILRLIRFIPLRPGGTIHLSHPSLTHQLFLYQGDGDEEFCQALDRYLVLESMTH